MRRKAIFCLVHEDSESFLLTPNERVAEYFRSGGGVFRFLRTVYTEPLPLPDHESLRCYQTQNKKICRYSLEDLPEFEELDLTQLPDLGYVPLSPSSGVVPLCQSLSLSHSFSPSPDLETICYLYSDNRFSALSTVPGADVLTAVEQIVEPSPSPSTDVDAQAETEGEGECDTELSDEQFLMSVFQIDPRALSPSLSRLHELSRDLDHRPLFLGGLPTLLSWVRASSSSLSFGPARGVRELGDSFPMLIAILNNLCFEESTLRQLLAVSTYWTTIEQMCHDHHLNQSHLRHVLVLIQTASKHLEVFSTSFAARGLNVMTFLIDHILCEEAHHVEDERSVRLALTILANVTTDASVGHVLTLRKYRMALFHSLKTFSRRIGVVRPGMRVLENISRHHPDLLEPTSGERTEALEQIDLVYRIFKMFGTRSWEVASAGGRLLRGLSRTTFQLQFGDDEGVDWSFLSGVIAEHSDREDVVERAQSLNRFVETCL